MWPTLVRFFLTAFLNSVVLDLMGILTISTSLFVVYNKLLVTISWKLILSWTSVANKFSYSHDLQSFQHRSWTVFVVISSLEGVQIAMQPFVRLFNYCGTMLQLRLILCTRMYSINASIVVLTWNIRYTIIIVE